MDEQNIRMVTIPLDEYMDLERRAEMNTFFIDRISEFQSRVYCLDQRLCELEIDLKYLKREKQ